MDAILKRDIHLEFCVSSNLRLGVIDQPSQHPLRQALRLGVPFSLNTDDPGPFQCTMTSECELVERAFGLTESDFAKIFSDTLRASFASRRSTKAKSVEL
jgi:adenosine deaminase